RQLSAWLFTLLPVFGEANDHQSVAPARNRTTNIEKVVFRIHFRDAKIFHCHLVPTHPPAHAHALEHARWKRRGADRSRRTVEHRAVRGAATFEVMPLDDALEALAFRLADHIDRIAGFEDVDLNFVADIGLAVVRQLD